MDGSCILTYRLIPLRNRLNKTKK